MTHRASVKGRSIRVSQDGHPKVRKTIYPTRDELKTIKKASKQLVTSDSGFMVEAAVEKANRVLAKATAKK